MTKVLLPPEIEGIRALARRAIAPLKPSDSNSHVAIFPLLYREKEQQDPA